MNDQKIADATDGAKLRALAEFAAGAGHEINNPLAKIIGYAKRIRNAAACLKQSALRRIASGT
jgi:signal transduction histidine kinase